MLQQFRFSPPGGRPGQWLLWWAAEVAQTLWPLRKPRSKSSRISYLILVSSEQGFYLNTLRMTVSGPSALGGFSPGLAVSATMRQQCFPTLAAENLDGGPRARVVNQEIHVVHVLPRRLSRQRQDRERVVVLVDDDLDRRPKIQSMLRCSSTLRFSFCPVSLGAPKCKRKHSQERERRSGVLCWVHRICS